MTMQMKSKKVTITIPFELNEQLCSIKEQMHVSTSSIFKDALEAYIRQKELEKWEKGIELAINNKEYMTLCNEIGNEGVELYEY